MKTKVNEVPLVGPRGRKELLKRINELEAQVAQQDYLRIQCTDLAGPLSDSEKAQVRKFVQQGVILDVVLLNPIGDNGKFEECKVMSHDPENEQIVVYVVSEQSAMVLSYSNE